MHTLPLVAVSVTFPKRHRTGIVRSVIKPRVLVSVNAIVDVPVTAVFTAGARAGETHIHGQWRRQDLLPGGAQKLPGVYTRRLSTYSRRQTVYTSVYTDKKYIFVSRGGHVPQ